MNHSATVSRLLSLAGVSINGHRPWDIQVHDERFFTRVLRGGSMPLGESYMDGWWDVAQLDEFFARVQRAQLGQYIRRSPQLLWSIVRAQIINDQTPRKAFIIGRHHYDLGNDLYRAMLDKRLTYTCGYWRTATTLDQAQEDKLDLICRKINLAPGMLVLDIGCGWGSFAKFAAERYGVSVVGVTVSTEQVKLARALCSGLPVKIRFQDYRDIDGMFDRIVSLGMIEHVGRKNYRTFTRIVRRHLKDDGLFLLHTIGTDKPGAPDPWIERYIFPNSNIPARRQLVDAFERTFEVEDWHNFGADYDRTLMAWCQNFETHWPRLKEKYGPRFYRMWVYFLMASAGSFRARISQLWQIVLSPHGQAGGYTSVR